MRTAFTIASMLGWLALGACAADWPMYRADPGHTGYTAEPLPAKLSLRWVYRAAHAPAPAWPRAPRLAYDRAYHIVVANGLVHFGSSADGKVYALDAATGQARWAFSTGAPVRLAPVVWDGLAFVVSDDGWFYCLAANEGKVVWKRRGGPGGDMILGNGRLISRWPARGGPVVADGVVYFGAGIWPSEGIYLYALDARTGRVLWCNGKLGDLVMPQPHSKAMARSGLSVQGCLTILGDQLLVPTGRAVPALLSRTNGELQHFHLQLYGRSGNSEIVAFDSSFLNDGREFAASNGRQRGRDIRTGAVAITPRYVVHARPGEIVGVDRANRTVVKQVVRNGKTYKTAVPNVLWRVAASKAEKTAAIAAGATVVVGAPGEVTAVDMGAGTIAWRKSVDGVPYSLAAADGCLYVSTDRGLIYCYGPHGTADAATIAPQRHAAPYGGNALYAAAADEILAKTHVREGYCIDLGCGAGELAFELARRTKLHIYAVDPDPANVALARRNLGHAGLYGVRVTVHRGDPASTLYPNYFADLTVSARSVAEGADAAPAAEARRLQRPYGGAACFGKPGQMRASVRGALEGAGRWTHQYCTPANTACSADKLAAAPLRMLWFHDLDLRTPNRHGRAPAPLASDGRLIVEGVDGIRAVSIYNGRLLWKAAIEGIGKPYDQEHLMGVAGTNSNVCLSEGIVYVATGPRCLRIDAASGTVAGEVAAPRHLDGTPGVWGYVACVDGTLFGTLANPFHLVPHRWGASDMRRLFTESVCLFALDAHTGALKWTRVASDSFRHNAIAIGGGRVFVIDRPLAFEERRRQKLTTPHPHGELLALDAHTGSVAWRTRHEIFGTTLALSVEHDALLVSYQPTAFRLTSELGGRLAVFRASTGERLWAREADYAARPVLVGRTIVAQPGGADLLTGQPVLSGDAPTEAQWQFERSYGCGIISACPNLLLFRSATLGYVDLQRKAATANYGGIRPGCWINTIPAGGLVLMPDLTNRCTCSYQIKASIALEPTPPRAAQAPSRDAASGAEPPAHP